MSPTRNTAKNEAVEIRNGEVVEDAGAVEETRDVEPNELADKVERRRASSQRPTVEDRERTSSRPTTERRDPQDHKESKAARAAAINEALEEDGKILCEYQGIEVSVDPLEFDLEWQLMNEQGRPMMALVKVAGFEGASKFFKLNALDDSLQKLVQSLGKQVGMGNS